MSGPTEPVVVIGAGPHGLAATAHLRAAGLETLCFGEPLAFWRRHMPAGMIFRSRKRSTHISDPRRELTIDQYSETEGKPAHDPLRLDEFIDYGLWYQRTAVPDVDLRKITAVRRDKRSFRLALSDGAEISAARVVVAAGLMPFAQRPLPFAALQASHVSHCVDHDDLGGFAERRVLVVGAGQSALESAALLSEAGARVELLIRKDSIFWLWGGDSDDEVPIPDPPRLAPPTDVHVGVKAWIIATPEVFRRMPLVRQERLDRQCMEPAGSGWLRPRLRAATVTLGRHAVGAHSSGEAVHLQLDDGSERVVDHVMLGTGYRIDVNQYPFLPAELTSQLKVRNGYPQLRSGLESSIPGLHFSGAAAAASFGPIMRFVVGTHYSARAITTRAVGRPHPPIRFAFHRRRRLPARFGSAAYPRSAASAQVAR